MTTNLKLILAAALFAVPVPAFAQIPPLQDIVTLEEICIGGAAGFTDEHAVTIQCPADPASARRSPPPNWEMTVPGARQWAKDVCSERDSLRSDRACYAAFLRQQIINREEDRAAAVAQAAGQTPAPLTEVHVSHHVSHFDAVDRCGPGGVNEWATYYAQDGRLHIDVWCLADDSFEAQRADEIAAARCGPEGASGYDVYREADGGFRVEVGCYAARQPFHPASALCRQEIIGRDEGLIATAPTNWEVDAGISETNSTPACHTRRGRP